MKYGKLVLFSRMGKPRGCRTSSGKNWGSCFAWLALCGMWGGTGSGRDVGTKCWPVGQEPRNSLKSEMEGQENFPRIPIPFHAYSPELLERGEQSQLLGGRVRRAQFHLRLAGWQFISPAGAGNPNL